MGATDHTYILWLATLAYALHIMEEYAFDWKTWAIAVMGFDVDWPLFYVTNAAVMRAFACENEWVLRGGILGSDVRLAPRSSGTCAQTTRRRPSTPSSCFGRRAA